MSEFTYSETQEKIEKSKAILARKMQGHNITPHNNAFYEGILAGILEISFGKAFSMNQQYIKDHYENEDRLVFARLFYHNTLDDEVRLFLKMKSGDSNWL